MTRWRHELSGEHIEELMWLIAKHLDVHAGTLAPNARFIEDLRASHGDVAALLLAIEDRFDLRIPIQDVAQLTTLSAIIRYLDTREHST